jgi:hypothetical protein
MSEKHEQLVEAAINAIDAVVKDRTATRDDLIHGLEVITDRIEDHIFDLRCDEDIDDDDEECEEDHSDYGPDIQ